MSIAPLCSTHATNEVIFVLALHVYPELLSSLLYFLVRLSHLTPIETCSHRTALATIITYYHYY